ncbi:SNF2 family N terminal domain [Trypanosoma vivax]|nr:SNF2 family N terminal domain [Trypanosoma vivax]
MSSALSGDVVPPKRGVRKRQREPVEDEVDCMADDVHVSFAARISSDPSRGGLVKPSGRDAGYMWDADASCREQAEAAWEGMGKEKRLLFLVEHLKYYMRYAVQKHLFPSSVRFASDVTEISREHTAESALLLQFHVSIPCVFRFVISEWQRVADMEATGMLGPSDHRFDTGNFVRSCLAHMRTVDGLTALLFISCPACRTIYLSDDALSVLLGILLEFGHLCPDDLLGGRSMETMLEALSKIDKRLYSASDHACAYSETHRQLMLLISHTKADVRELWKGFDVSLFPVFSSALQGESAAYVCKKNGQGNEVTRESMIPAQDTTQIPGTPCEECVQSQKCRSPDSNRFGFSDCGGLDHTTSIFTDCHRFSMLEREVRAHETVWSEDSCKLEVVLHAPVQHCIAPSQPTTQLKLRELMGAFFILHRAVSEQAQRRGFVLESLESRIVALYNESLVSGLIPSASTFSTADRACSVALGDDSMVEPEHLARRENVAARGTFRENLSIQELMPENMCPAAVLSGVAAYSTKHLADLARATESFFPREYIKAQLKPHQLESLAYMLAREKRGMAKYVEVPCDTLTSDDLKPHNRSINRQRSTSQRGRTCVSMFYSSMMATCFVVRSDSVSATRARQKARCGFLCDEMGLGKTLVILSLCAAGRKRKGQDGITAPRRPLPYYRAKVGSFRKAYTNGLEGRAVTSTVNSCSGEIIDVSSSSDTASDDGSDLEEVWSNPDTIEHHRSLVIDRTVNWNLILGSGPREGPPRLPRLPDLKPLPNTTLITVPYSLLPQWVSEIDRFYPSARYIVFHGPARFRYTSDDFMSADFVITTYETLTAHLREETDGVFCLFSHLAPRDTTRFVALKEWDALNAAGCCRGKAKRASSSLASSEASSALQNIVDRSFRQVVGCMERTNLTSRTILKTQKRKIRLFLQASVFRFTDYLFERIVLDESQKASCNELLLHLHGRHRWVVSGTPINNHNYSALEPVFSFLGVDTESLQKRIDHSLRCDNEKGRSLAMGAVNAYRVARGLPRHTSKFFGEGVADGSTAGRGDAPNVAHFPPAMQRLCFCRCCNPYHAKVRADTLPLLAASHRLFTGSAPLDNKGAASISGEDTTASCEGNSSNNIGDGPRPLAETARVKAIGLSMLLSHFMVRHEKIPSLMQTIQLTPLKEACVPVPLSESERFLYNHVSGIIQGEVARLQRQGLLANRMMKVLAWVRLMTSVALHPSTVFAELNNGAPSLLPRHREKLVEFDPSFSESFVSVSASEALDWALEHHVEVEEHVSGASPTSVVPEATLEVLRKLSRTPSELPNCPICLDTMLKPTLLSCFHIFCKECVAELAQAAWSSKGTENVAYCPFCRCGTSLRQRKRVIDVDVVENQVAGASQEEDVFPVDVRPAVSDDVLREHLTSVAKGSRVSRLAQLLKEIWQKHPNDSVLVFSKVPSVLQPGAQAVKKTVDASVHVIDNYLTLGKRKKIFAELHSSKQRTGAGSLSDSETSCLSGGSRMVVFLSSHVASVGLNLTFANHLIFMEANINPTLQQQAIGRINCFGQKKEIHVYFMYAPGTIEEKILKRNSTILQDETQSTAAGNRIDRAETGEKGRMGQQLTERSDEACQLELCSLLMP